MRRSSKAAAGIVIGAAGAAVVYRILCKVGEGTSVGYPPLDTLKPIAEALWIVDSGPINTAGLALPVRMTVVRLSCGDLFLHSPTRFTPELARELETLGPVRHLVAPNIAHWTFLKDWQRAFPEAITWGVPGLRERAQVRRSGVRIDRDLSPDAPREWAHDLAQGMIAGGAGFQEAYFFDQRSRTLLLTDLIQNLDAAKLPPVTRVLMGAAKATQATTSRHVRAILRMRLNEAATSIHGMIALAPDRVIFTHGRPFLENGAVRLRQALGWVNG